MSTPVCVHCGQPTRFRLGDVFQCKGGCAQVLPLAHYETYSDVPMTVTAPAPPPDPEPEPKPEPKPKQSRYPWRRKR